MVIIVYTRSYSNPRASEVLKDFGQSLRSRLPLSSKSDWRNAPDQTIPVHWLCWTKQGAVLIEAALAN